MELKYGPYSPSRLDTGICGYSFQKQYIDPEGRKYRKENLPQARGSAMHEVLELITKKMITDPSCVISHEELREWVTAAINRHPASYEEIDSLYQMAKDYIRRPPKVLTKDAGIELKLAIKWQKDEAGNYAYYDDAGISRPQFEECDYDDPGAFARGRADILLISDDTTKAIIYDHKTQPNTEEADTFQMGFYAWVISRYYPFLSEISTILHFARYAFYSEPYIWTKDQLIEVERQVIDRIHNIESRTEWPAVPNNKCQYCPFLVQCPEMKDFIEINEHGNARVKMDHFKVLGDTTKAVKIAGIINVLEDALSFAKDELKEHVKAAGSPIAIPGKVFEYRGKETVHWDKVNKGLRQKTIEVFKKHGVDPMSFMGFSQTFSQNIWMAENESLVKELSDLFPRKLETTFKGYKM